MSRIALGCMRMSTDDDRDEARAVSTIAAAFTAGIGHLDTAHAYGRDDTELGHNERLIAPFISRRPETRVTTKCGMSRVAGRWEPDGRAASILAGAEASAAALGRPPDVLLLHAPDPRVPLATSVRALVRAREAGLAKAIGLSNVTRRQLDELPDVELAAVQVALGAFEDAAARGGVVSWCRERRIAVQAHSPLGGPSRAARLSRDSVLCAVAARHEGATGASIVLAYLLASCAEVVPIVGARRPETVRAAAAAARVVLDAEDLAALDARFPGLAMIRQPLRAVRAEVSAGEVVLVMGLTGSGKSRLAETYVERGYERLNRDTLGGTLAGIARRLDERLAAGAQRLVLDNTYVTRASRSEVLRVASARGVAVRCVYLETPVHEARTNVTMRMLERYGRLLGGAELKAYGRKDPGLFAPDVVHRMERQLEKPSEDEGFASIDVVSFVRDPTNGGAGAAIPISDENPHDAVRAVLAGLPATVPVLLYGWRPDAGEATHHDVLVRISEVSRGRTVEVAFCGHGAGVPVCWCRPPMPGLWLSFAVRHRVDARLSVFFTSNKTHATMARTLGAEVQAPPTEPIAVNLLSRRDAR